MRKREAILSSLERVYREAYERAQKAGDSSDMDSLDLGFQRDQLLLEALLDVRALLAEPPRRSAADEAGGESEAIPGSSLLEKAQALRKITGK